MCLSLEKEQYDNNTLYSTIDGLERLADRCIHAGTYDPQIYFPRRRSVVSLRTSSWDSELLAPHPPLINKKEIASP